MSKGMVRPLLVAVVVALSAHAHGASELPRKFGLYPAHGAPLAMLDSKIAVRVRGPIAEAVVTQTFRNDTDRVTEATYIFPLPVDAAVSAMEIETGSRTIRAAIETREQAQQRYERAISAGVGAGLLDQERPDVFTQTVSAIPAHGTVVVTLRFDTVARYSAGTWELALPMTVAPRYVPGTASGRPTTGTGRSADTDRAPDASRVTPGGAPGAGGKTEVTLDLEAVDDVTSPTHELAKDKAGYHFTDARSDHDAVIRWRAKAPSAGWVESADDGGYAAVVVEAPAPAARKTALRVMLVLDRAATTRGDADAVKRPVVRALLGALSAQDRVALAGADTSDYRTAEQIQRLVDDTWGKAAGAFDLTKTLRGLRPDGPIVLVTDGLVADDRAALAAAGKLGVAIHVIGIGPAPNRGLLTRLAATTGGTVRFALVDDAFGALATAVLADCATPSDPLSITWGTLAATDVVPATLPRLGAGQAMLVLAKVKRATTANARVRGDVFGFTAVTPSRTPDGATTSRGALARRWAKLELDDLLAAGNAAAATEHALRYGLVSPYTSMVAIGDEVIVEGGVKHSVSVPVSVPEGMRWQQVKHQLEIDMSLSLTDQAPAKDKTAAEPTSTATIDRDYTKNLPVPGRGGEAADDEDEAETRAPAVAMDLESRDAGELVPDESFAGSSGRRMRFSLSAGGGVSVRNGDAAPIVSLGMRAERPRRPSLGGELNLRLVDGLHVEGTALATVGKRIIERLELRVGAGLTVNPDAAGPALNLTLRARIVPPLAAFLRYDGALLVHDGTFDGQNATSLGIEASF
jgi:Ca-activated chloride channel family protein